MHYATAFKWIISILCCFHFDLGDNSTAKLQLKL